MIITHDGDYIPETIDDWIEIHGEPNYEQESTAVYDKNVEDDLHIKVTHCKTIPYNEQDGHIGLDKCVYTTDKGSKRINYPNTVEAIARANDLISVERLLYSPDGAVSDMAMRKEISDSLISAGWTDILDSPVTHVLNSIKDTFHHDKLPVDKNVIPFANGDLHINHNGWEFREGEKKQAAYRLAVNYINEDLPMPWFTKWVNDTFVSEDITTLQELLGYCLVPVTAAQEAFILVGEAGVGKSVLTYLLSNIFGNAYQELSIKELAQNKYYTSLVENKLVVYDDDLHTEAISETGIFKKLVTANQEITAERKYEQPHQFLPYCTIIANSNDMIKTLYDDSDGFYRRLHPLHVKDKDPHRRNISNMAKLVAEEKDSIARWALKGLQRVIAQDYKIFWSDRSREYMGAEKSKGLHFPDFMSIVFDFDKNAEITTKRIASAYEQWCRQNAIQELSMRRLQNWIGNNADKLHIAKTLIGNKRLAGYSGLKLKPEWEQNIPLT
jgi:putative DNA primase/helicase